MSARRAVVLLCALSLACSLTASELDITPAVLTNGEYGVLFHRVITVTGGAPPYTELSVSDFEAFGTGVAEPAIDLLTGTVTFNSTPTNDGGVSFTVTATDSSGALVERDYVVLINFELVFNAAVVVEGVVGHGLGVYIPLAEGTPPYTSLEVLDWNAGGTGADPPVVDLTTWSVSNTSGITGDGVATFRVRATDSAGGMIEQAFTVYVDSALHIFPRTLPPGSAGTQYEHILHVAAAVATDCCADIRVTSFDDGGTGLAPPVPDGDDLTFLFSSTPTAAGTATAILHVADMNGGTFDATYSITIHPAMTISPTTLPEGTVGELYDHMVAISGGVLPYKLIQLQGYSASTVGIPTPTMNRATGTVTFHGTPPNISLVNLTLTASDAASGIPAAAIQQFTLVVAQPLSISPATLPDGDAGQPYEQTLTVEGGSTPYTTLNVNAFSAGGTGLAAPDADASTGTVTFDSAPTSAGTASFSINVVDSFGRTLTRSYSIVIHPSAPGGMLATASAANAIAISWNASAGATAYHVERSADAISYSMIGMTSSPTFSDTTVTPNSPYLYRVRAVSPSVSPYSAVDLATATIFTDASLPAVPIRAVHFSQLRTAVNGVRTLAGLPTVGFASGPVVLATHLTDLRDALAPARTALGLPALTFTQPTITPGVTSILAADLQQLRDGVK